MSQRFFDQDQEKMFNQQATSKLELFRPSPTIFNLLSQVGMQQQGLYSVHQMAFMFKRYLVENGMLASVEDNVATNLTPLVQHLLNTSDDTFTFNEKSENVLSNILKLRSEQVLVMCPSKGGAVDLKKLKVSDLKRLSTLYQIQQSAESSGYGGSPQSIDQKIPSSSPQTNQVDVTDGVVSGRDVGAAVGVDIRAVIPHFVATSNRKDFSLPVFDHLPSPSLQTTKQPRVKLDDVHVTRLTSLHHDDEVMLEGRGRCNMCNVNDNDAIFVHGRVGHQFACMPCATMLYDRHKPCPVCNLPILFVIRNSS